MIRRATMAVGLLALLAPGPGAPPRDRAPNHPAEAAAREARIPGTLEEMIAVALRSNPEILLAEAKLRQAQAELNQIRLKVVQDVAASCYQRDAKARSGASARERYGLLQSLLKTGRATPADLADAEKALIESDALREQADARLRYLLGLGGGLTPPSALLELREPEARPAPRPTTMDAKRTAILDRRMRVAFQDRPLSGVLEELEKTAGLDFLTDPAALDAADIVVTLGLQEAPLRALLLALADMTDLCFIFRDYGVLVTTRDRALRFAGPAIPPEVPVELSVRPPGTRTKSNP